MADTTIHFMNGDSFKVKLENESARVRFVEAYKKRVEGNEVDVFVIQRDGKPPLIVPVMVLRNQTYLETA